MTSFWQTMDKPAVTESQAGASFIITHIYRKGETNKTHHYSAYT